MALKEELLALDDRAVVEVEVKAWGGRRIRLKAMSAAERDAWELSHARGVKNGTLANVRASLVGRCIVDEAGVRVFGDGDLEALGTKSAAALDQLYDAAAELNGITAAQVAQVAKG